MKIELKNVKYFPSGSEETNCFTADVVIDGKKIGYARNQGHGGNTDVSWNYSAKESELKADQKAFNEAEKYAKALPPHEWEYDGQKYSHEMNMESLVDNLFEKWLVEKETAKAFKKMDKAAIDGIVTYNPTDMSWYNVQVKWSKTTIEKLLSYPKGLAAVVEQIKKIKLESGEKIYNPALQSLINEI